jgi:hypothetical protein
MKRVVLQHQPNLYAIVGIHDDAEPWLTGTSVLIGDDTFYRAESHDHYILLKRAVTGGGAVMDPRQR